MLFPFKGKGKSTYRLYEDDGLTNEYTHTFAFIHVDMETTEDGIKLSIQKEGTYELSYDQLTFHVPNGEKRKLIVNGTELESKNGAFSYSLPCD